MKKSREGILPEIGHFSVKDSSSQSVADDLMTDQTISAASSHSRSAQ
jgi:hypothetical protein